jgi:myosin V
MQTAALPAAISLHVHFATSYARNRSILTFIRHTQFLKSSMQNEDDNDNLAYWLSNTSSLLFLLEKSLKAAGAPGSVSRKKPPQPTSIFGRMAQVCYWYLHALIIEVTNRGIWHNEKSFFQGLRSASFANMHVEATDVVRQVEAKYPALLFKQQLTAYVEKIYGIVRDNIKRELSSLISLCIQVTSSL